MWTEPVSSMFDWLVEMFPVKFISIYLSPVLKPPDAAFGGVITPLYTLF